MEENKTMKTSAIILVLTLSGIQAYAQSSANSIEQPAASVEGTIESDSSKRILPPVTITNTSGFHSNYDEVPFFVPSENRINANKFYNTLSGSISYKLDNIGVFETTYTPTLSATYVNADTNTGQESDTLKDADIKNALSMKAESGNVQYGLDFTANYHYGYRYLPRNTNGNLINYRRNDANSNFSVGGNTAIAVSSEYRFGVDASIAYQDAYADRLIWISEYDGMTYDMTTYSVGISNDVIINDNFTLSMPISYRRQDYHNFAAIGTDWLPAPAGDNRLRDRKLGGLTLAGKFEKVSFSIAYKGGVMDDKGSAQIEDADLTIVDTTVTVNFTESLSATATHGYEKADYDTQPEGNNEKYNNYSVGVSMKNVAGLGLDATLSHDQTYGQCNWSLGQYKNIATGLNLSFKL